MGTLCYFVSDLHGSESRYRSLLRAIEREGPAAVFLGGDLLPSFESSRGGAADFVQDFLQPEAVATASRCGKNWPQLYFVFGNDDARSELPRFAPGVEQGLWRDLHMQWAELGPYTVAGYSCVPPTPFMLKDWERYDVSRFVDPGCVSPEEGYRSLAVCDGEELCVTMVAELDLLCGGVDPERAVLLCHSPPYGCDLDRAALDGQMVDHVPLDLHVGSIALQRLIAGWQPLLSLHGHVHESARLTGSWRQRFGRTHAFSAAHDGPELALIRFELERLEEAERSLLPPGC